MLYGANSRFGLARQSAWGTRNTTLVPFRFESYDHQWNPDKIENSEIFGVQGQYDMTLGQNKGTAQVAGRVYPTSFGNLLTAMFGIPTTTGTTDRVHTFNAGTARPLIYTLGFDDNAQETYFGDNSVISKLTVTHEAGQPLKFSSDWLVGSEVDNNAVATVATAVTETSGLLFNQLALTFDAAPVTEVTKLEVSIDNPVQMFFDSAVNARDYGYSGPRKVTFSATLRMLSNTQSFRNAFLNNTPVNIGATWNINANLGLTLNLPRVFLTGRTIPRGNTGVVEVQLQGQAVHTGTTDFQAVLRNAQAAY